jgi:hypothetical protein
VRGLPVLLQYLLAGIPLVRRESVRTGSVAVRAEADAARLCPGGGGMGGQEAGHLVAGSRA